MSEKWFEVTVLKNTTQEQIIMDVPGYSHFKFNGDQVIWSTSVHHHLCSTVFIQARSRTSLEASLKTVFGYRFTKFNYNTIKPFSK